MIRITTKTTTAANGNGADEVRAGVSMRLCCVNARQRVVVQMWRIHYSTLGAVPCPASLGVSDRFVARLRLATDRLALCLTTDFTTYSDGSEDGPVLEYQRADSVSDTAV